MITKEKDNILLFEFLILKGLKRIGKEDDKRYLNRLKHEFDRIVEKKYVNYFVIVSGFVNWAKKNNIMVGVGRGSAGASLVSFCLGITNVDPLKHKLLFARFLSSIRSDMPDVDLDFADIRRHEIFSYLQNTYGINHCAKVVTNSRFHPKGILRDIGRIFNIPITEIEKMCNLSLERSGGDARSSFSLLDTFLEFSSAKEFRKKYPLQSDIAIKMEGHIRNCGLHAAALVVTGKDIATYVPIKRINGEIMIEWEKNQVEEMKLIKFDILGLKTLSIIDDCTKSIGCKLPKNFDDQKVYKKIFQDGKMSGIFQFGSTGMTKFAENLHIENFNELADCTSLFRPSCLHSGQAMTYTNRKKGKEPIEPFHPALEKLTKNTKHVILYQEQIMQIMHEVGDLSWATAEMGRKIITKSKGKNAFNVLRKEFVTNASKKKNMGKENAEKLFDVVSTFGSYGFNQAHAVEYSIISYYTAWLKTYYPEHFFKSILKFATDQSKIQNFLQDAEREGVEIKYPNVNKSDYTYDLKDNKIYAGLNSIVGIGEKVAEKIIKNRPFRSYNDFIRKTKISSNLLKGLIVAEAFRDFNINKRMKFEDRQRTLFDTGVIKDFSDAEHAQLIYKFTTLKPKIDLIKSFDFGDYDFVNIDKLNEDYGGKQILIRGIITDMINKDKLLRNDLEEHIHQFEKHTIYLNLNDGTGNIAIQINPHTYELHKDLFDKILRQPIIALGHASKDGKKMYGDVLQIVGENYSTPIKDIFKNEELLENEAFISSASPAISKKKNSYYRITLHNGIKGLWFRPTMKIFPGMKIRYLIEKEPFINIRKIYK